MNSYIVNKCAFSGLVMGGFSLGASKTNWNENNINKLLYYGELIQNWRITQRDYSNLLTNDPEVFTYLDPPYKIPANLYGQNGILHKMFNHQKFRDDVSKFTAPQLISYNAEEHIKESFNSYKSRETDWCYCARSDKKYQKKNNSDNKELVLINY